MWAARMVGSRSIDLPIVYDFSLQAVTFNLFFDYVASSYALSVFQF